MMQVLLTAGAAQLVQRFTQSPPKKEVKSWWRLQEQLTIKTDLTFDPASAVANRTWWNVSVECQITQILGIRNNSSQLENWSGLWSDTERAELTVVNQTAESRHIFAGQNKPACRALGEIDWLGGIQIAVRHSHAVSNRRQKEEECSCDVQRYKCNTAPYGSYEMISLMLDLW